MTSNYEEVDPFPSNSSVKSVTIFNEPEIIPPEQRVNDEYRMSSPNLAGANSPKRHRTSISSRKMTGRPALASHTASASSLHREISTLALDSGASPQLPTEPKASDLRNVLNQVVEWLVEEKLRHETRRHHHRPHLHHSHRTHSGQSHPTALHPEHVPADRSTQLLEEQDQSLTKLEDILAGFVSTNWSSLPRISRRSSTLLGKGSIGKKYIRSGTSVASSDTEYADDDVLVPGVEADLDNSKVMAFSDDCEMSESAIKRDHAKWVNFKQEIVRLTHTLKLKGWRRVPIEQGEEIQVIRLSGALTNCVYVVKPPANLLEPPPNQDGVTPTSRAKPLQLLLRVYGAQAEHLIDRDSELSILRRLCRKRIGPRLLGTFHNGRFEEFLHAKTLTAADLRVPEIFKQIARRMRELHEGIDLLPSEIEAGPTVFLNWDKCIDRCETVITWLDKQVKLQQAGKQVKDRYVRRGYTCGVEWPLFRRTYNRYRKHLIEQYGGKFKLGQSLVFAHNDTQYGNLMRIQPSSDSNLPKASDDEKHKQLVVIDFEYAGQSTVGLEFANHFTEWCYNYHDEPSYECNIEKYPTLEQQQMFVRSYVNHRPQFISRASQTPIFDGKDKAMDSEFDLDKTATEDGGLTMYDVEKKKRETEVQSEIDRLLQQTRMWRVVNSAWWVAWGIVQAEIPELDDRAHRTAKAMGAAAGAAGHMLKNLIMGHKDAKPMSDPLTEEEKYLQEAASHDRPEGRLQEEIRHEGDDLTHRKSSSGETVKDGVVADTDVETDAEPDEEEFDYLSYSHDRALFFWGDVVQMGFVDEKELPESLRKQLKIVKW